MYLDITEKYQTLFNAQLQLADMLVVESPSSPVPYEDQENTGKSIVLLQ